MSAQPASKVLAYWQAWISSLATLLSRMTSADWQAEAADIPAEFSPKSSIRITAEGGLQGRQWINLTTADMASLLGMFLGEEVSIADNPDEIQVEALEELMRQWCGLAATALKAEFGEVRLQVAIEPSLHEMTRTARLLRTSDETRSLALLVELEPALAGALDQDWHDADSDGQAQSAASAVLPAGAQPPNPIDDLSRQGNLSLLMDVELPVMLRFGSRQVTLQEVLELATGVVLELDREIQEPVELVLNQKVIARGEVVIVDGNYGLRVMEVASPQQRVSSL
jgi:flagellar motor switch protein FliN/FliY